MTPGNRTLLAGLGTAVALAVTASDAHASLLDEPPRALTFDLKETAAPSLPLLRAYQNAEIERPGPMRRYFGGVWGQWRYQPLWKLGWNIDRSPTPEARAGVLMTTEMEPVLLSGGPLTERLLEAGPRLFGFESQRAVTLRLQDATPGWLARFDVGWAPPSLVSTSPSFAATGFDALWTTPKSEVRDWRCRRSPVKFVRYGAETDSIELVRCDGSVAPHALDRLSILARPPEAPSPGELLPDEPDEAAWTAGGEWVPQVRVLNPRLLWALQRIADAFPWRNIYIHSGYRPKPPAGATGHQSLHGEGRAMDIHVMGVANEALFKLCRTLEDVGCGYYPNSKFVHVDVRRPGNGRALWIDPSGPGEPSRYVDSWPGVLERGGMAWSGRPVPGPAQLPP